MKSPTSCFTEPRARPNTVFDDVSGPSCGFVDAEHQLFKAGRIVDSNVPVGGTGDSVLTKCSQASRKRFGLQREIACDVFLACVQAERAFVPVAPILVEQERGDSEVRLVD